MHHDRRRPAREGQIATVYIGTISAQGTITKLLPGGYARVTFFGRVFTGRLA